MKAQKTNDLKGLGLIDNLSPSQKEEIEKSFFKPGDKNLSLEEILAKNKEKFEKIKRAS
jgi:hypothetical protein